MKKIVNVLFTWLLAFVICFGSAGNLVFASEGGESAPTTETASFEGVRIKAKSAMTAYRRIQAGAINGSAISGKAFALRINVRSLGGLAQTELDPKFSVDNGANWKGLSDIDIYYVTEKTGAVATYHSWWSIAFTATLDGWVVIPLTSVINVASDVNLIFAIGVMNDWSGLIDFDLGAITAFDMPADTANLKESITAGTKVYDYTEGEAGINSATTYEFGDDDVSITRVHGFTVEPAVGGYFNGVNFKVNQTLIYDPDNGINDYAKITFKQMSDVDVSGKALAIRVNKKDNDVGQIDMKPDGTFRSNNWYLNYTDWSVTEGTVGWSIAPEKMNGWIILAFSQDTFSGTPHMGFGPWSFNMDIDIGAVALIDIPEEKTYDAFENALANKTVVCETATDLERTEYGQFESVPEERATVTRVEKVYDVEQKPIDGYFNGANVKVANGTVGYDSLAIPCEDIENIKSKAVAIRVFVRQNSGELDINVRNKDGGNFDINGDGNTSATYYYLADDGSTITTNTSWWSIALNENFNGYVVMPFAEWTGEYKGGNLTLSFVDNSAGLDFDIGTVSILTMPQNVDYQSLKSAIDVGEDVYRFTTASFAALSKAKYTVVGTSEGLIDDGPKVPSYCSITGDTKVMNFELKDGDALNKFVGNATDYPECEFAVTERGTDEESNKALHVKIGNSSEAFTHSAIELKLKGYGTKIEQTAKGLTFYIKNYKNSSFHINIGFDLGHRWYTKWNGKFASYQLYNVKTGEESVNIGGYEGLYIPANFEGYVRVSFRQFVAANWVAAPLDWDEAVMNNSVSYMSIDVNTELYSGYEFDIDDIGWYYGNAYAKTSFIGKPEGAKTIAELMATADYFAE